MYFEQSAKSKKLIDRAQWDITYSLDKMQGHKKNWTEHRGRLRDLIKAKVPKGKELDLGGPCLMTLVIDLAA